MEEEIRGLGPSLLEAFRQVPGPRKSRGKRHPLPSVLALATCAMLCNCHSLYAIAQWGREHPELIQALGFTREQTPTVSTLHQVFSRLNQGAFEGALKDWALRALGGRGEAIAIDGKSLRGIHGEELPGVDLVGGLCPEARLGAGPKGGRKDEAELTAAPPLLAQLKLKG